MLFTMIILALVWAILFTLMILALSCQISHAAIWLHDIPYKTCYFYSLASRNPSKNHARHIGNRSGTPVPVCCRHGGIRSKSTDLAPDSQNLSSNPVAVSHRSHTCVELSNWSSLFRPFANVAAHRWRCHFWAVPNAWNAVFQWIPTVGCMANRFQAFSTAASADRNWSSGAGLDVRNGEIDWANPSPVAIRRQMTPTTSGSTLEYCFQFAAATVEYGQNRLSLLRTIRIHRVTPSACFTGHTLEWNGLIHDSSG